MSITKWRSNVNEKKFALIYEQALPIYLDYLLKGKEVTFQTIVQRNDPIEIVEKILLNYVQGIQSEAAEQRIDRIVHHFLLHHYRRRLKSSSKSVQMNTLYMIRTLKINEFQDVLLDRVMRIQETNEVTIQWLKTAASLHDPLVINVLAKKHFLTINEFVRILNYYDAPHYNRMIHAAEMSSYFPFKRAVMIVLSDHQYMNGMSFIQSQLSSEDRETRITALKAIYEFSHFIEPNIILPFLSSDSWVERMHAVKICGRIKLDIFEPYLQQLIGDSSWWVRYHAGEALYQLKDGTDLLETIQKDAEDPYARDMAQFWLGKIPVGVRDSE